MENTNGSLGNVNSLESKADDKELKKTNSKLPPYDKSEKAKQKETTPKNKQKEQENNLLSPIPTIDTNLDTNVKKELENPEAETGTSNHENTPYESSNTVDSEVKNSQQTNIDYTTVVKSMNLDDIFINLNLIAKIEQGDKLYIQDKYVNIDTSYIQSIMRWYWGVDRKITINFIKLVINKAFEFCDELVKSDTKMLFRLTNDLRNSISGLTKLKNTYATDKLVQAEIDVVIEDIRSKIESTLVINN
jgi:hypothetical protein